MLDHLGTCSLMHTLMILMPEHYQHQHRHLTSSTGQPVGYNSGLVIQRCNTQKQQLRALGLQTIIHLMR